MLFIDDGSRSGRNDARKLARPNSKHLVLIGGSPHLGDWQLLTPLVQSWLGQWAALVSKIPEGIALAALLLPVAFAIFSGRLIVLLGCLLLAAISFCALVVPASMPAILAIGVYLGSVIIALSGIVARQKAKARQAEFARLREDVERLLNDEQRHFLEDLKSSEKDADR
jgi:hypothetical protein